MKHLRKAARIYSENGFSGLTEAIAKRVNGQRIPQAEWTEFMQWLVYAVPGMMVRGNVDCFSYALARLPSDAPMIEIGSWCGLSTCMLGYLKRVHGVSNRLFCADRWIFQGFDETKCVGDSSLTHEAYGRFARESFIRNVRTFSSENLPHPIELFSDEFFQAWATSETKIDIFGARVILGGPISFAFIDGNHIYEFVRRDFENVDRFLEPGGFILFDDSGEGSIGDASSLMPEVLATGRYVLIAKNPNYLVQKIHR